MKKIRIFITVVAVCSVAFISCSKGASSPQDVFNKLSKTDRNSFSQISAFVVPDERPVLAFTMDLMLGFITQFGKDKALKDDYRKIREKYKLPDATTSAPKMNIRNPEEVMKFAQKTYGKIDVEKFLADMEVLLEKTPGKKQMDKSSFKELKDVKIEGDSATGISTLENGSLEKVYFKKIGTSWYISIKDSIMKK